MDLFPDHPPLPPLRGLTRQNALSRLATEHCPHCGRIGRFGLFNVAMHIGIVCRGCGVEHPFHTRDVMWLPDVENAWKKGKL